MKKLKRAITISLVLITIAGIIRVVKVTDASLPVTVLDDHGRTTTIDDPPQRIVCIGPSCTEIAYALGLGDRVVGVDVFSDYPPEVVLKQRIFSLWPLDPEQVAALNPDLVLAYSWGDPAYADGMEKIGLKVVLLYTRTIDGVLNDLRLVGNATGKLAEAEALALSINQRIDEIKDKTSNVADKPKVYLEYWYPPPWTFGPGTWGDQLIELAGGINIFNDAAMEWVMATDEDIIARNPDIITSLCGAMHYVTLEDMKNRPGWEGISAIKNNKVYLLDENLFVRAGPRLVDGLEALSRILHPDLFGEANVFTFVLDGTKLKTSIQLLELRGPLLVDITVLKVAGNCTLIATASRYGPEAVPKDLKVVGSYIDIDCSIPEGLAFTLRIYYTDDQLRTLGVSKNSLKIYSWDSKVKRWVSLNSAINKDDNYVEALVMHASYFALVGEVEPPLWMLPVPLWLFIIIWAVVTVIVSVGVWKFARIKSAK